MGKNKSRRYTGACINGEHIVLATENIKELKQLENGYSFKCGIVFYYSPYLYESDSLLECEKYRPEGSIVRNHCPDSL